MSAYPLRTLGLVALLLGLASLAACQLTGEMDKLRQQNVDLQNELNHERALRMAAETKTPPPPPVGANTGFTKIEGVETIAGQGKITVRVPGDVLFSSGRASLKESSKRTLDQIAAVIGSDYKANTIRIEGYTDTDPIRMSNWADNLELSLQRSAAVYRYLESRGVDPGRMYAAGFGESKPRATKEQSRRVEIVVVLSEEDSIMIGIIDYGMGNLRSVQKALEQVGAAATILPAPAPGSGAAGGDSIAALEKLILPGVGAFADGMEQLRQRGWIEPIRKFVATGKPFLGICLGMQLLFEGSEEDATDGQLVPGLALLPGNVVRFRPPASGGDGPRLKVPHMGWNTITWQRDDPLLRGLPQNAAVYFVHSYYAQPRETSGKAIACATADYGRPFCATLWQDNIWATQFHPEKSQTVGMKILENFVRL